MIALTNHTIDTAICNGYGRCPAVPVWISVVRNERRVVLLPRSNMEERSHWQIMREYVETKKILYVLTDEDAQGLAQAKFGRDLTEDELWQVKKCIESGLGYCWSDIMEVAIREAIGK